MINIKKFQSNKILTIGSLWLLIVLLSIVTFNSIPFGNIQRTDFGVYLTFIINGFLWSLLLVREINRYPFSIMMMHWAFCLLFFFFAAIVQYSNDVFPWVNYLSDASIMKTNIYLSCWTVFVFVGNLIPKNNTTNIKTNPLYRNRNIIKYLTLFLITVSALNLFYLLKTRGILLSRINVISDTYDATKSSIYLLRNHFLQSISYFAVVFAFINSRINKKYSFLVISFIILLLSYFPLGISRYSVAVIYLGLLLTFSTFFKKNKVFIILFLSAFLIVFPVLNAFRNTSFYEVSIIQSIKNIFQNLSIIWLSGDYDAYTMLNLVVEYISNNSVTFGYQLLGVILFFVPRTLWYYKPIGSGAFVAESNNWNFTNISCPLPAEGLINFGFVGLILFGIVIGFVAKKLDLLYWKNIDIKGNNINKFELIYPILLMFFFFMCRGDLLSSTAYMMAYVFTWFILTKFLDIKIKR